MSENAAQDNSNPKDEGWSAFYDGLRGQDLRIQVCSACGLAQLGCALCQRCGSSDLRWSSASGAGKVYSSVVVHVQYNAAFEPPYAAGIVELVEGPCIYAPIEGDLPIGCPVEIAFPARRGVEIGPEFSFRKSPSG